MNPFSIVGWATAALTIPFLWILSSSQPKEEKRWAIKVMWFLCGLVHSILNMYFALHPEMIGPSHPLGFFFTMYMMASCAASCVLSINVLGKLGRMLIKFIDWLQVQYEERGKRGFWRRRGRLDTLESLRLFEDEYAKKKIDALTVLLQDRDRGIEHIRQLLRKLNNALQDIPQGILSKPRYQKMAVSWQEKLQKKTDDREGLNQAIQKAGEEKRRLGSIINILVVLEEANRSEDLRDDEEEIRTSIAQAEIAVQAISSLYDQFFKEEQKSLAQLGGYEEDVAAVQSAMRESLRDQLAQEERSAPSLALKQGS
ncbi:MAG: hypothetical protein Q7S32_03750 [bacterium]|nr:hypothetical protein [bacterium]